MNLHVSEKWKPFIRSQDKQSGHYRSEDEVLDEALRRLLKQRDSEHFEEKTRLEAALDLEGLDSGLSTPMTSHDWDEVERQGQQLIATRKARKAR